MALIGRVINRFIYNIDIMISCMVNIVNNIYHCNGDTFMKKMVSMAKDAYLGVRTTKEVRQILEQLAEEGYRTLSQQCEMIIVEWLKEQGHLEKKPTK